MKSLKWLGLLAALQAVPSWAREPSVSPQHRDDPVVGKPAAHGATPAPMSPLGSSYTSPFADYRRFVPDEPLKDWRTANDEVRDSRGHMGLMKSAKPGAPMPESPHHGDPAASKGGKP